MDETREIVEAARDGKKKKDVMEAINFLVNKNIEEVFPLLKDIFFHPLTNHEIRMEIGQIIASTKSKQVYNLLVSHLILRNFADLAAVIYTLGEYKDEEVFDLLIREYSSCNFEAQIQIINAMGKLGSTDAIEFFSKIFNGDIPSSNLTQEQTQKLKQVAGENLQKQVMDI